MKRRPFLHLIVRPEGVARLLFGGLFLSLFLLLDGYVLILTSRSVGIYLLLALVATTGLVGSVAVLAALRGHVQTARERVSRGEYPQREFRRTLALLAAASCLVVPGLATDVIGVLLTLPPLGWAVGSALEKSLRAPLKELCEYLRFET